MKRRGSLAPTALLLAALVPGCEGPDIGFPWDFERMLEQPRYEPYGESDFFADGRAMRRPPEGTVPRPVSAPLASGGRAAAAQPARTGRALFERGRERYAIFCSPCHGLSGHADTPVAASMRLVAPRSLHAESVRRRGPDHVRRVIETGYGLMPSYASLLGEEDAEAVVGWVRVLWRSQSTPLDALPPDLRRRAEQALAPPEGAP